MKTELKKLQPQFPMFLDGDLNDSANLNRIYDYISDTMLASVYNDCKYKFPDLTDIEAKLTKTFRYVKCYYPEKKLPDVFTYVSGFDYEYPVYISTITRPSPSSCTLALIIPVTKSLDWQIIYYKGSARSTLFAIVCSPW